MEIYTKGVNIFVKQSIKKLLFVACKELCCKNVSLSLSFVSEEKIKELNSKFRGVDRVTDVLSFPMEEEGGEEFPIPEGLEEERFLGDIVICTKRARQQAKEYGHSYKRELSFLALHGFLHLLGYDHETKKEEKEMMSIAEKILKIVGVERNV